ncbi:unnamed protein product [Boreogadus saida]
MEERLIISVSAFPEIFNTTVAGYKDRTVKTKAWLKVSEEVGLTRMPRKVEGPEGHLPQGETQAGGRKEEWVSSRAVEDVEVLCNPVFPLPIRYSEGDQ